MDAQKIFENLIDEFLENGIPIKREQIHPELSYINSVIKLGSCKWNGKKYVISRNIYLIEKIKTWQIY